MKEIHYTLLSEGSSDRVLISLITWLLREYRSDFAVQSEFADLRLLPRHPKTFAEKIKRSIDLYPCHILFIHRDADNYSYEDRKAEIWEAVDLARTQIEGFPEIICIIPIRMQEAWFLFDEQAIRSAAGNPNGSTLLRLPRISEVEDLPDPKGLLHNLLREASELHGRRLKNFNPSKQVHRVAEYIADFDALRSLVAFQHFEYDLSVLLDFHFPSEELT